MNRRQSTARPERHHTEVDPARQGGVDTRPVVDPIEPARPAAKMDTVLGMTGSEEQLVITPTDHGFAVTGEIDAHTAPSLATAMAGADRADLTLDLSGVEFIDSSGLRVLIEAHRRAGDNGGALHLTNPSDSVRRLLDISGLDEYLDVD